MGKCENCGVDIDHLGCDHYGDRPVIHDAEQCVDILKDQLSELKNLLGESLDEEWWPDTDWCRRVARAIVKS